MHVLLPICISMLNYNSLIFLPAAIFCRSADIRGTSFSALFRLYGEFSKYLMSEASRGHTLERWPYP